MGAATCLLSHTTSRRGQPWLPHTCACVSCPVSGTVPHPQSAGHSSAQAAQTGFLGTCVSQWGCSRGDRVATNQ